MSVSDKEKEAISKNLTTLVTRYGEVDSQIKTLSKELDGEKVTIKNEMEKAEFKDFSAGGYKVTRQVSYRTTYDEDKMLKILKKDWANRYGSMECPYIKTKEYIDMDQLESVLYAGEIPDTVMLELNGCQSKQEVVALKCSKEKKKAEG